MAVGARLLAAGEVSGAAAGIVEVYRAVFTLPPWDETGEDVARFGKRFAAHAARDGFRCAVARDDAGAVVGFAYGRPAGPGAWWHAAARRALGREAARRWLGDAFEFVELAVVPPARGQGAGGRLHDALLAGLGCRTALLTTLAGDTAAARLYRGRGWSVLAALAYPGSDKSCVLMGVELGA